ncbi:MAG: hypothetical protein ACRCZW_02465 [Lactobacillaceae bacterium]
MEQALFTLFILIEEKTNEKLLNAPFRKLRVKGRHDVCFTPELSNSCNMACSEART